MPHVQRKAHWSAASQLGQYYPDQGPVMPAIEVHTGAASADMVHRAVSWLLAPGSFFPDPLGHSVDHKLGFHHTQLERPGKRKGLRRRERAARVRYPPYRPSTPLRPPC